MGAPDSAMRVRNWGTTPSDEGVRWGHPTQRYGINTPVMRALNGSPQRKTLGPDGAVSILVFIFVFFIEFVPLHENMVKNERTFMKARDGGTQPSDGTRNGGNPRSD